MIETDVLVIGAGPAGSSAARFAAKGGVDVIVLEKKSKINFDKIKQILQTNYKKITFLLQIDNVIE